MSSYEHVRETMARLERVGQLPGPAGETARRELASLHEQCRADTAIDLPPIVLDADSPVTYQEPTSFAALGLDLFGRPR